MALKLLPLNINIQNPANKINRNIERNKYSGENLIVSANFKRVNFTS